MKADFNEGQKQAIMHHHGAALVLAGPGSGKTRVITYRTKYLIEHYGVDPSGILVITFTKAAAMEMKQRFQIMTDRKYVTVNFGTFHAVFFGILRHAYGYTAENIIREEQRLKFFKEEISHMDLEIEDENDFIQRITGEISRVKNERINILEYEAMCCGSRDFRKLYQKYDNLLRRRNLLDFDDMMVYTYELLTQRNDILRAWQNKFRYILIDETQDMNQLQYEIVKLLAAPENNLFMVGDDDQSIYRFRGAAPEIMLGFEKDYPDAVKILLDTNYRSRRQIVEAGQKIIVHNQKRFSKEIKAFRPDGNPVIVHTFDNQQEEYECIIEKILHYHKKGGAYSDIAVLSRTNRQPGALAEKLMEYNIPFQMKDSIPNIYDHWIAKNIMAYLRLGAGSNKRSDLLQILNKPLRYISRECLEDEMISWDVMLMYYEEKPWMCERVETLEHDIKMLKNMKPYGAIHYIRHVIGYEGYLRDYAIEHRLNVEELLDVLEEIQESAKEFDTLEEWQEHIAEYGVSLERQHQERNRQDGVVLSTMHSSKGLEFPIVFIPDVNEGITPYQKAVLDEEIEEERRLFYVALTRARELLYIFSVRKRFHKEMEISRFVGEFLGDSDTIKEKNTERRKRS
ncbi:MAG: ATP-dependent helicase [Lachnospiraceae bacterium]